MVRKIRISRHGLTRCPSCSAHIKVAFVLAETACPFCEASLQSAMSSKDEGMLHMLSTSLMVGRSSLIAASLLGLSLGAGVGCSSDSNGNGNTDIVLDVADAPDIPSADVYGLPPDGWSDTLEPEVSPEPHPQDLYGVPPDPNDP